MTFRTIADLFVISRIAECVYKSDLIDHLTSNKLLNSQLSYIFLAISSVKEDHKKYLVCLLNLSADFDTIDHSILINHF